MYSLKDQRVSDTAIVENKRLGHALSIIKAQQDLRGAPKVMTNSEKIGYKKRTKIVYGPPGTTNELANGANNRGTVGLIKRGTENGIDIG